MHLARDEPLDSYMVATSGQYPVEKEEMWWLIVGNKKTNKVFTTKRCILKQESKLALTFDKDPETTSYTLYALCDSYLGCDQVEEIEIKQ